MASPAPVSAPVVPTSGSPAPTAAAVNGTGPAPSTSGLHHNVVPSEVGWQFVPQYYTFVNKSPNRLHKFYTRNSTFIHGTEGEEVSVCYGQQDIHQKIMQIGYQDCKVFIHSVDAQSSAAGGIIIQVIGEMSNAGEVYRKFVQTFFLAEQPNGYFVLNDIFRFLKEDTAGEEEEEEALPAPASAPAPSTTSAPIEWPQPTATPVPEPDTTVVPEPPRESTPAPPPPPAEKPAPEPEPILEPPVVDEPKANRLAEPAPTPAVVAEPTPDPDVKEEIRGSTPAPPSPAPEAAPVADAPAPTPAPAAAAAPAPAPTQPTAPPKPKTWANLAASGAGAWGTNTSAARAVSVQAKPAVVKPAAPAPAPAPAPAAPAAPRPSSGTATPASDGEHHPNYAAALTLTNGQCFVKGVTETVSTNVLKEVLTTRFGAIKELDIVRSKACAFLEFTSPESARRAVIACLPVNQGGEGGIRIEGAGDNGGPQRITVEARKERGDRPPPRPHRGGVPPSPAGDGRGTYRGRGGPPPVAGAAAGRGRGAAPPPGGAKA